MIDFKGSHFEKGRCFTVVDATLDCCPKLVAIDEEPDHQIVHALRLGKTNRAPHQPFDPGPQIHGFALNSLHVLFPDVVLLWGNMPLVGPPPVGVKPGDAERLQEGFQLEKALILPAPKDGTLTLAHGDDRSHATTIAGSLSCLHNSTSHRVPTSALDAVQAPLRNVYLPPCARDGGVATQIDSPVAGKVPFF
jgi:hypothetical protein